MFPVKWIFVASVTSVSEIPVVVLSGFTIKSYMFHPEDFEIRRKNRSFVPSKSMQIVFPVASLVTSSSPPGTSEKFMPFVELCNDRERGLILAPDAAT